MYNWFCTSQNSPFLISLVDRQYMVTVMEITSWWYKHRQNVLMNDGNEFWTSTGIIYSQMHLVTPTETNHGEKNRKILQLKMWPSADIRWDASHQNYYQLLYQARCLCMYNTHTQCLMLLWHCNILMNEGNEFWTSTGII